MKYRVQCEKCHADYSVDIPFTPGFCAKCGNDRVVATVIKTKSRITAEEKMKKMDNLRPRLEKAWGSYIALRAEYEDELQSLAQYRVRGIVSDEEYHSRQTKSKGKRKDLHEALKEYRAKKKELEEAE